MIWKKMSHWIYVQMKPANILIIKKTQKFYLDEFSILDVKRKAYKIGYFESRLK